MKPQKLVICGWGPYKNKVEVDFNKFDGRGIFLITGPTGAGKTTIFDAISYALYGLLSGEVRDKERNSVRSDFAEADTPTYVELFMTHGGGKYQIRRNPEYMRPKKRTSGENALTKEKENAILYLPDEKVIEGVKEVNSYIKELLALDHNQFKQLSMIAQGEFARLLTAPPRDKTKIFREIFGTGIYERFTAALGNRAKKSYQLIMEQKNKFEEDVRLLCLSVEDTDLPKELKETFLGNVASQYWNNDAIIANMVEMQKYGEGFCTQLQKNYEKIEKELDRGNGELSEKRRENRQVMEYRKALETKEAIAAQEEIYRQKEIRLSDALNAAWVEVADMKYTREKKALALLEEDCTSLKKAIENQKEEIEKRAFFWQNRERLHTFIGQMETVEKQEKLTRELQKDLRKKEGELEKQKKNYVEKEKVSLGKKHEYEEAQLSQKRAAIGLAAGMLIKGEPCPVCGSREHPNPAALQGNVLSEQELEGLKLQWEQKEKETGEIYQQVIVVQTQVQEWKARLEAVQEEQTELKEQMAKETDPIFEQYLEMGAVKAMISWKENSDAMNRAQSALQEKEAGLKQVMEAIKVQVYVVEETKKEFEQTLNQYGFASGETYRSAFLSKELRESLQDEIKQYQQKKTANKELVEHLQQTIKEDVIVNLEELEEALFRAKVEKDSLLKDIKKWEQFVHEVKKNHKLCREKKAKIEEHSKEYGVVKELENIASGNNARKLVFEQYVLAGYFEEILQAANIRFRKMTSGRYEMHRTREVGDGRVKDNLEIEVMDFYTGKYRSIRTLSGGESFKASLSLALGLSDVIQAMSGGIRVDTLFIDEGFGALDSESLDQACATLMSLVETERMIGIISHVSELRERISKQIIVEKAGDGSTLKVVEGV